MTFLCHIFAYAIATGYPVAKTLPGEFQTRNECTVAFNQYRAVHGMADAEMVHINIAVPKQETDFHVIWHPKED